MGEEAPETLSASKLSSAEHGMSAESNHLKYGSCTCMSFKLSFSK